MKKILWLPIILVVIFGLSYFVTPKKENKADYIVPTISTESWKTYKNNEYGFEFKYPVDFKIKESISRDELLWLQSGDGDISISVLDHSFDPKKIQTFNGVGQTSGTVGVGPRTGYVFGTSDGGCSTVVVQTNLPPRALQIRFSGCEQSLPQNTELRNMLLSTFWFFDGELE